jgi:hypothetical protein
MLVVMIISFKCIGDVAGQMCNLKKSPYRYKLLIQRVPKWRTNGELRFRRDYRKREQKT